jgi:dsDNA-specific endonuclease/ATPase MutS2
MQKKIIRITEGDIENLVKKILKEEKSTVTHHPAYPIIDDLESTLDHLKMKFKKDIANSVSGEDGYHSDIDKFSEEFNKFINKVSQLKRKINDYEIQSVEKRKMENQKRMEEIKSQKRIKREEALKGGKNYSY